MSSTMDTDKQEFLLKYMGEMGLPPDLFTRTDQNWLDVLLAKTDAKPDTEAKIRQFQEQYVLNIYLTYVF